MNKIRSFILRKYNAFISIVLSILGFGAVCGLNSCEYGNPVVEYGAPHATFIVKGNVKSEKTSANLPNIKIVMGYDSTYSNENGDYQIENLEYPDDQTFLLKFKDVDGTINGEYQSLDTLVQFINPEFSGGSGTLDKGETEKELNVKLKEKE